MCMKGERREMKRGRYCRRAKEKGQEEERGALQQLELIF